MQKDEWNKKVSQSRFVENEILKWCKKTRDEKAVLMDGYFPDYDIRSEKGNIEIKEDRLAHKTGNYALEFTTHDDKPSGIMNTKADLFIIVDWEYVCMVDVKVLKDLINELEYKKEVDMGETFSDGKRNRGYLIPRDKILNNPMASVVKRWFPVIR